MTKRDFGVDLMRLSRAPSVCTTSISVKSADCQSRLMTSYLFISVDTFLRVSFPNWLPGGLY